MSRILRRPMFRGGRVSAYGTGIASGLADGGMPNKRGLVTGPGGYGGKTGKDIFEAAVDRSTYFAPGALPGFRSVERILKGKQYEPNNYLVEKGFVSDVEGPVKDLSMAELIDMQIGEKGDVYQTGSIRGDNLPQEVTSIMDLEDDERIKIRTDQAKAATGAIDGISTRPKVDGKEEAKKQILPVIDGEDTTIGESDLASMVSRYEELLGGKKAKGQDISDMLLRFAGAEGDDTMSKFQKFAAKEADVPSRTEKIKQAAAMLGIKYEQAKDIAAISALGKKFSPGITEKTATYIKSLPKGSPEHATALAQIKWPSTLDRKIAEAQMSGVVTLDDINVWAGVYIDNYKGTMTEESVDGVFLDKQNSTLRWVDENGEVTKSKPLNIK